MFNWITKTFEKRFSIDDYTSLLKRFEDIESRLRRIELENDDYRDRILRKIQSKRQKEEEVVIPKKGGGILSPSNLKNFKNGNIQ